MKGQFKCFTMGYYIFQIYLFFKAIDQDDKLFLRAFVFYKSVKPVLPYQHLYR